MPRGRPTQPPSKAPSNQADGRRTAAPNRARRLLLAAVVVLLVAWLGFMAVLAFRG